jgi:uncharacterized protein with FMN-binding domain
VRRALIAVVGTVAGLAALLNFKTSPTPLRVRALGGSPAARQPGTTPTTPTTPAPTGPPATTGPAPTATQTSPHPTATSAPSTPHATAGAAVRTFKGSAVQNQLGVVLVSVTLRGTQIIAVNTLQMPFDHPRSQYISEQVAPMLLQEVLAAQSAQIDVIGGATYTTESYAQSLQAALDASRQ